MRLPFVCFNRVFWDEEENEEENRNFWLWDPACRAVKCNK